MAKTRKKIREGRTTAAMDWNETNTLVMQFLASVTQQMRGEPSVYEMPEENSEEETSMPSIGAAPDHSNSKYNNKGNAHTKPSVSDLLFHSKSVVIVKNRMIICLLN